MGIKIELVILAAITFIVVGSLNFTLNDTTDNQTPFTKELEFTDTIFTEVDTEKLQSRAYSSYGKRDDGILYINNVRYETETITSLVAKKGTYMGESIYLEGDIEMHDKDGYIYRTQQAEYNQKTEILDLTAPFIITKDKNIVKGDTLTYHTRNKEAYGTVIDAVIYTIDK